MEVLSRGLIVHKLGKQNSPERKKRIRTEFSEEEITKRKREVMIGNFRVLSRGVIP